VVKKTEPLENTPIEVTIWKPYQSSTMKSLWNYSAQDKEEDSQEVLSINIKDS